MNYEQFAIWLHGFLEISNAETINEQQTQIIKDHLALLFEKKTPDRSKKKEDEPLWLKKLAKEWEKDIQYPNHPPYAPMPMPTYPGYEPLRVVCSDNTGSSLPDLGNSVAELKPCNEIPLGEPFEGVDLNTKFDTELHKNKTYC